MKKSRIFILSLLMLNCLSSTSYAAQTTLPPVSPISVQVEGNGIASKDITIKQVDGFYLNLALPQSQKESAYIPTFTVNILNEAGTKVLATAKANEVSFDKILSTYKLVFRDFKDFKLNDKFKLSIVSNDPVVKGLNYEGYGKNSSNNYTYTNYVITNKEFGLVTILDKQYTTNQKELVDPNAKITNTLYGNSDYPAVASIITDATKTVIMLQNEEGQPMSNLPVKIHGYMTKENLDVKSDANGLLILDTSKVFPIFTLTPNKEGYKAITYSDSKDKNGNAIKVENATSTFKGEFPLLVIGEKLADTVSFKVNVRVKPSIVVGGVVAKFNTQFSTDLSKNWEDVTLNLTDSKGNKSLVNVTDENPNLTLEDGIYKVAVEKANYADVTLQSKQITVIKGKAEINMTLVPKHVLSISKENKAYKFSVINVESIKSKEYQSTKSKVFAVTPGETFMIRDNDSSGIQNVTILPEAKVTKVNLSGGVSYDNVSTDPHTGDSKAYLLALTGVLSIVLGFCLIMYFKNRKLINMNKNSYLSLFLVGVLTTSMVAVISNPKVVYADGAGSLLQSGTTTSGSSPSGNLVNDDSGESGNTGNIPGVLKIGFIPTAEANLTENSSIADIASIAKYVWDDTMLYVAPTKRSSEIWSNSGYLVKKSNDLYVRFGTTPLNNSAPVNVAERTARTLACNTESDNSFISNISKAAQNKNLQNDSISIGTGLSGVITSNFYVEDAQESRDKFFSDYILLLEKANVSESTVTNLKTLYAENKVSLFVQSLVGFRIKDSADKAWGSYCYVSVRDVLEASAYCQDIPVAQNESEMSIFKKLRVTSSTGAKDAKFGGLSGAGTLAVDDFMAQLRPTSTNITEVASSKIYGAWAFWHWENNGLKVTANPKLTADLDITVVDKTGKATGESFVQPIEGWVEKDDRQFIAMVKSLDDATVSTPMTINHNSKLYTVQQQENTAVDFFDITDNEKLNKNPLTLTQVAKNLTIQVPSLNDETIMELVVGGNTESLPKDLHKYLGGPVDDSQEITWDSPYADWYKEDLGLSEPVVQENKYKDKKDAEGKPVSSNAKAIIYVTVVDSTPTDLPVEASIVPEWRLSKYFNNISETVRNTATFSMKLKSDDAGAPSSLTPSGIAQFSLVSPNLSTVPWAKSTAKWINNSGSANITHNNTRAQFELGGNLLATRTTSDSRISLASWLNIGTLSGVDYKPKGVFTNLPTSLDKQFIFKYGILNPTPYIHAIGKISTGKFPHAYTVDETPVKDYTTADYDKTVRYYRYTPKSNTAVSIKKASTASNGVFTEATQSSEILNINPEIAMAIDDEYGNTSIGFVAGDKLRQIKPTIYNKITINADVKSNVEGISATDSNAKILANTLGAGGKSVLYRGSGISASYDITGTVIAKSFALDIAGSSKATWNPTSTYKSEDVNNAFLGKFATKDATGVCSANMTKTGGLKINAIGYSNHSETELTTAKTTVISHNLVVRGGKLISVDGKGISSISGELKEALTKMNLLDDKGILSVFVKNEGAKLGEQNVADLFNAARGTADATLDKGWYSEDTSLLLINEYTTTFALPKSMFFGDKIPMSIPNLEAPVDKSLFFRSDKGKPGGYTGHTTLSLGLPIVSYKYDSTGKIIDYVVGNVSVLDSTN